MKFKTKDGNEIITQPAKSIIGYAWVRMRQEGAVNYEVAKATLASDSE